MSPEARRIAIAEACPKSFWIYKSSFTPNVRLYYMGEHPSAGDHECDPLRDLNACHHMEKAFKDDEVLWHTYATHLQRIVEPHRHVLHATAAQRAEAFLRTLNLWDDSK